MSPALHVENLSKTFRTRAKSPGLGAAVRGLLRPTWKRVDAVADVSFAVEPGEMVAFIGPNGAGKSTTIKLMTGILYPDAGSLSVLGLDPHRQRRALARRIGTVFGQKSQLWYHLPPGDSFRLLGAVYDIPDAVLNDRVAELTEAFDLAEFLDQPVRKLSLGQRIRCEIAASLLHRPEILFLDEPTIGLDVVAKKRIRDLIRRINEEQGVTVFLTSHDAGDIEKICRRVLVINHGRVIWDGAVKEMKYTYLNRRVIAVKTGEEPRLENLPDGMSVLKRRDYAAKVEVDLDALSLEAAVTDLLHRNSLEDIAIAPPPLEEIIADLYESASGDEAVRRSADAAAAAAADGEARSEGADRSRNPGGGTS